MPTMTIPQQSRQGSWRAGSASIASRYDQCDATFNIHAADYVDPAKSITVVVETSADAGQTYAHAFGFTWTGGARTGKDGSTNPMPVIGFSLAPYEGLLVSVRVEIPSPLRVGAVIRLT